MITMTRNIFLIYKVKPKAKSILNHIIKRTMFSSAYKTATNIVNKVNPRTYTTYAAKAKITNYEQFNVEEKKNLINPHAQCVTDFNLIYEDPKQIQLFQIGTLFTKATVKSHNLSEEQNYSLKQAPQQIAFFKEPLQVTDDLHIVKSSREYFNNNEIKQKIENTQEYKVLFDQVLLELKTKAIKVRIAENETEKELTGLHVLERLYKIQDKNAFLDIISLKNYDKE